jgi:hypothetical protein
LADDVDAIAEKASALRESMAARSRTLEVLGELGHSLERVAGKLAQVRETALTSTRSCGRWTLNADRR